MHCLFVAFVGLMNLEVTGFHYSVWDVASKFLFHNFRGNELLFQVSISKYFC